MKKTSGSEKRRRERDVRIRLDEEEIAAFDAFVANAGFHGQRARGDWLRTQIGLAPPIDPDLAAGHQRVPLPGGQALLAEIGKAGVNLKKIAAMMTAIGGEYFPELEGPRAKENLAGWIEEALLMLFAAVDKIDVHLDMLGPRR